MKVVIEKKAQKALLKMDRKLAARFVQAFHAIAGGREAGLDIKPLAGREGFRLRIGGYRAIYTKDLQVLSIVKVGPRGDVYK